MGVKYDNENNSVDTGVHRTKSKSNLHDFPLAKCSSAEVNRVYFSVYSFHPFSMCVQKYIHTYTPKSIVFKFKCVMLYI